MFADDEPTTKRFTLGKVGDRVFFMNSEGTADWAGVFGKAWRGRARVLLRNVMTGEKRTIRRLPKALTRGARPRPFPIQAADSTDLIGYVTTDATDMTPTVYDTSAEEVLDITFSGLGTIFVGDYVSDEAGEEVGLESDTTSTFVNPTSGETRNEDVVSGTPVDEIQVAVVNVATTTE